MRQTISERRRQHPGSALFLVCLICSLDEQKCYLTEKPKDAIAVTGQLVTFTCHSTSIDPIRWSHRYLDDTSKLHVNTIEISSKEAAVNSSSGSENGLNVTGRAGSGSPDGYWSMLEIAAVNRTHRGTYSCVDGAGSRGFAILTVKSTAETVCLTVSPRDQVVVAGDSVVFTASGNLTSLRYYYESSDKSPERVELYDGEEFDDCNVDERFSVVGVGDKGHADLVIRSVQPQDAGRYIVKDAWEISYEVAANLVVFDRLPECSVSEVAELRCQAKYSGHIKPRIFFGDGDVTDQCLQPSPQGGVIDCSLTPSNANMAIAVSFVITFQLTRCGETDGHWKWMHTTSFRKGENTSALLGISRNSSLTVFVVVSVVINVMVCVSVIIVYALCKRWVTCCSSVTIYDQKHSPSVAYDQLHKATFQAVLSPTYEEMQTGDYEEVHDIAVT